LACGDYTATAAQLPNAGRGHPWHRLPISVPRGVWQGARLLPGGAFALLGATVSPGFEFADFELAQREALLAAWPEFSALIASLTR